MPNDRQYRAAADRLYCDREGMAVERLGFVMRVADGAFVEVSAWVPKAEAEREGEECSRQDRGSQDGTGRAS